MSNQNEQDNDRNMYTKTLFRYTGLSIKEFADKIHVLPSTVSKWISGKSEPQFVNVKIMRSVFRKEVNYLDANNYENLNKLMKKNEQDSCPLCRGLGYVTENHGSQSGSERVNCICINEQDNRQMTPIAEAIKLITDERARLCIKHPMDASIIGELQGLMFAKDLLKSLLPMEKEVMKSFYMEGVKEYAGMYDSIDYEKRAETEYNEQFKPHE